MCYMRIYLVLKRIIKELFGHSIWPKGCLLNLIVKGDEKRNEKDNCFYNEFNDYNVFNWMW